MNRFFLILVDMRAIIMLLFLILSVTLCFSQKSIRYVDTSHISSASILKRPLERDVFSDWPNVGKAEISNDGKYASYVINDNYGRPSTSIIKSINGDWTVELQAAKDIEFTDDSRMAVYIKSEDSLCIAHLGGSSMEFVPHVEAFELFKMDSIEWLVYQLDTGDRELVLYNLEGEKKEEFPFVSKYLFNKNSGILWLVVEKQSEATGSQFLCRIKLASKESKTIWDGVKADNLIINDGTQQVAFRTIETVGKQEKIAFWYYNEGTEKAIQLVDNLTANIDSSLQLDRISGFTPDGSGLFIRLKEKNVLKASPGSVKVDIWSYMDARLQSEQLRELRLNSYLAVLKISELQIIRIQQPNDGPLVTGQGTDSVLWVISNKGVPGDAYWSSEAANKTYVISIADGLRRRLKINFWPNPEIVSGGKYLVGIDEGFNDLYSYEFATGVIRNLTHSLPVPLTDMINRNEDDVPFLKKYKGFRFAACLANGDILIYDQFDIWLLNLANARAPRNVTNGYGRKNHIILRLASNFAGKDIRDDTDILLVAFNTRNKYDGFFKMVLSQVSDPRLLSMGPFLYYNPEESIGSAPIKSRDADIYLVQRQSSTQSPNYFWTKDFKAFYPISNVYPEKKYNWMRAELFSFKTLDARTEQAILYKPDDFNPRKKYPIIVHYYERMSQNLYKYQKPGDLNGGQLDIAWFVSHGYLVCTPDIHYRTGETGQGACNSIVAVAGFLARYPWVDMKRIGIQGHSFGGYETNYIVSHSNLFAAAISSSGPSDLVSEYGSALRGGNESFTEVLQPRIGATLWERPETYIKNSPLFTADKINTPLLMVANEKDQNVSYSQGVEFFLALRRLGKKAWMLQYDDQGHAVFGRAGEDWAIRMQQFFDYYLLGTPASKWMIEGIPASKKGVERGLELENSDVKPGKGLLN
jgi:dienelactone hydrolase